MMKIQAKQFALIAILGCFSISQSLAQIISYKRNSLEFKAGFGGTIFLGDLGGGAGKGKGGFLDFDVQSMRANSSFGLKFNITNSWSLRTDFSYAQVAGNDAFSEDQGRFDRNLSFRSDIYELSVSSELVAFNFSRLGNDKTSTSELYGFVGIGMIQFNPQAELNGVWYDLQPLGTEGQGLKPNTSLYSLTSMVVPYGIGYRHNIGKKSYIGIEISMRKSFTDYIDDVSGTYYSKDAIQESRGQVAADLSDRSLSGGNRSTWGRGNPGGNDNYSFIQLVFSRNIGRKDAGSSRLAKMFTVSNERCPKF